MARTENDETVFLSSPQGGCILCGNPCSGTTGHFLQVEYDGKPALALVCEYHFDKAMAVKD